MKQLKALSIQSWRPIKNQLLKEVQDALTDSQVSMISSSKPSLKTLSLSSTFINYTVIPANKFGFD